MMNNLLRGSILLPAIMFMAMGLLWWVAPAFVGEQLGMTLLTGLGLSTQVGDMASFFITLSTCLLLGLKTGNRTWFFPPIMLLSIAALGRVLAWLFHDAALAPDMIAVEVILSIHFYIVSGKLAKL